jgi:hypothetical protein
MMRQLLLPVSLAAFGLSACAPSEPRATADSAVIAQTAEGAPFAYERIPLDTSREPGTIIDSVFPMPEMMRRFRAGLPEVTALVDAPTSRQALVEQFVAALAARDVAALGRLTLSRAEFAWLYYPVTSDFTQPNGLPPTLRWTQLTLASEKGIGRALDRMGPGLSLQRLDCPNPPVTMGPATLHVDCTVRISKADGSLYSGQLFGPILEYAGHFKFTGYTNRM